MSATHDPWMARAIELGNAARGTTAPNPNVGCVIVKDGTIVGEGATGEGGRPHAEAVALKQAGDQAKSATLYTTLEPCAHDSERGPTCSKIIPEAGIATVVVAVVDPDTRTAGKGLAMLREAGLEVVEGVGAREGAASLEGFLTRMELGRPFVTLKLALSIDGKIALPSGESKWITGSDARAHVHFMRSQADMILVGRGTLVADNPSLDVRLPGLEERSPRRALLTGGNGEPGWEILGSPEAIFDLEDVNDLMVEGGSGAATAFLKTDLVDRILIYRAPILIGEGKSSVGYIGLDQIADAHGRWKVGDPRVLGIDRLEVYERVREE